MFEVKDFGDRIENVTIALLKRFSEVSDDYGNDLDLAADEIDGDSICFALAYKLEELIDSLPLGSIVTVGPSVFVKTGSYLYRVERIATERVIQWGWEIGKDLPGNFMIEEIIRQVSAGEKVSAQIGQKIA